MNYGKEDRVSFFNRMVCDSCCSLHPLQQKIPFSRASLGLDKFHSDF